MNNSTLKDFRKDIADRLDPACLGDVPDAYQHEPRNLIKGQAKLLLRPRNTQEVSTILRTARQHGIGIVPYGGGTGLVGGQIVEDGSRAVLLSLERMNRIRAISGKDNVIVAEAGVILSALHAAAEAENRLFPLSLASEGSCQIGGNLATNAGGVNVLRYGNARDLCLGLEVVLADGSVWDGLSHLRKDNTGYDLRHLIIGSEGTLGIITAASLRLFSLPERRVAAMIAVPSPDHALDLLLHLQDRIGDHLSAFELMSKTGADFLAETMPDLRQILDPAPAWSVLLEVGGPEGAQLPDQLNAALEHAFEAGLAEDALISQNEEQRRSFWRFRETIPEANRLIGAINSHDISVPREKVPSFITDAQEALARLGPFRINCFGHLGDGNLHFNVFPPKGQQREAFAARKADIRKTVYDLVQSHGGSVSAEHGIGRLKKDDLLTYGDPVKRAAMQSLKSALDPGGILNPGAIF